MNSAIEKFATETKDIRNAEDMLKKLVADNYGIQLEREPSYL